MYKKLINNTLLFAIGNIFSKFIIFALLPIHTRILSPSEIGNIDLIVTTITIGITIFGFNYIEGFVRYSLDKNINSKVIFNNSLFFLAICIVLFILFSPILSYVSFYNGYIKLIIFLFIIQAIHLLIKQYCRANQLINYYVIGDIVYSATFVVVNIYFILILGLGINGYIYSLIIAYISEIIYLAVLSRVYKIIDLKLIKAPILKKLFFFSIPLLPNAILWWVINVTDRYMISMMAGVASTGIYVVSSKIPAIINIVYAFFYNAWQITAIDLIDDESRNNHYSQVTTLVFSIFVFLISCLLLLNNELIDILFGNNVSEGKQYMPWLSLSVIFSCMSSLIGMNYLIFQKNKIAMISSIISGLLNIFLNFILINILGGVGAAISTMISFFVMFIYRIFDVKVRFKINLEINFLCFVSIIMISSVIIRSTSSLEYLHYILLIITMVFSMYRIGNYLVNKMKLRSK